MVIATRSSSKNEEGEALEVVPPVRTRGRASSSRNTATTRRSRRNSAVEDNSNDAGNTQGSEVSDHGSLASTDTESQRNSASPSILGPTPSRRLRRKRGSDAGSCGSSTSDFQETSNADKPEEEKETEPTTDSAVQETPKAGKPPASPSRRRRGSSSSSQAAVTPSPARITRAMRKAGISTPKDVVELEIVLEEETTEDKDSKPAKKESKGSKSPAKSPGGGEKPMSPTKPDTGENTDEEVVILEEPKEAIGLSAKKSPLKAAEVTSPEREQKGLGASSLLPMKSPGKKNNPEISASPAEMEIEEVQEASGQHEKKSPAQLIISEKVGEPENVVSEENPSSSPSKKSPGKEMASEEVSASPSKRSPRKEMAPEDISASPSRKSPRKEVASEGVPASPLRKSPRKEMAAEEVSAVESMDGVEKVCTSSVKKSPAGKVSPFKAAAPEIVDLEAEWSASPTRKSLAMEKTLKEVKLPRVLAFEEQIGCSPKEKSPRKEVPPVAAAVPEIVDLQAECSSSSGKTLPVKEGSPEEIAAPENVNLEAGFVISPIKTIADEVTPMKTITPGNLQADPLRSPTKKSPVKEASPKNVLCFEDTDVEEIPSSISPQKKSPKKVSSPQKDRPEEVLASSPLRKSPRKADTGAEIASELPEGEPVVSPSRKSPKKDVVSDVAIVEDQNDDEESSVPFATKVKKSPMKDLAVSDQDAGGPVTSLKGKESHSKVAESVTVAHAEEPVKKPKGKKLKKTTKASTDAKATVEDEQEVLESQDGEKFVELESFKKLFKRPKYYSSALGKPISALFTYASQLESRKNDLPPEFMNTDAETMWQFIVHRSKQISKEFRKRSDLLDVDLKLHGEAVSSEDESDDLEENEDEEELEDEEEVEADLLNLKDEDLKDLEREMAEMREEDENQEEEEQDENKAPRKKYPKSALDDKFFSLAEMNAFLDEQDRMEGPGTDILDTADDSSTGPADYCYEDFFGKRDATEEPIKSKEKKLKKRTRTKDSDKPAKKAKTVRFAMDEEQPETDGEAEGSVQEEEETEEPAPVLLGEAEEPQQETSNLKKSLKRLKETIKKLEAENLAPKSWEMSGEVTAQQRGENELLETHLQFDHGIKKAPEITEVFTEKLEDLIKQRIKDKAFDDVVRKKRIEERNEPYRNQAIEEREMVKTSLAEVYEKEYQKAAGEAKADNGVNEEHVAIEKQVRELFRLIDALSNFDYTPPEVRPEVRVVSNMPALRVEEVGMSASTDAQLLAPEELKKRQKGDLKADDERDSTDKLRQRRKKKNRQRAMVELFGEEKATEGLKKKKKKVAEDKGSGGEKLKSTAFFSKLQETVRNEIKEKTTKKKKLSKVKSQQVSSGGSKFML